MGKIHLKIPKEAKDGVPTDSVSWARVTATGSGYPADAATPGVILDGKKIKINLTFTAPQNSEGATCQGHAVISLDPDDPSAGGKMVSIDITNGGSGYTSPPTFTFPTSLQGQGSGAQYEIKLGTGIPEYDEILIYKDGEPQNKDGLHFKFDKEDGVRVLRNADGIAQGSSDLEMVNLANNTFKNVEHFSVYNSYNKRIDHSDSLGFLNNVGKTIAAWQALGAISDIEKSTIETNRKITTTNQLRQQQHIRDVEAYEADLASAKTEATNNWRSELADWQNDPSVQDLVRFSTFGDAETGYPINQAEENIYSQIINDISPVLQLYNAFFPGQREEFMRDWDAIRAVEQFAGAMPTYQYNAPGGPPTAPPNIPHLAMPNMKIYKQIANFQLIAAACWSGVAVLGHIYDLLSGKSGVGVTMSAVRVTYGPNCFRPKIGDSTFVSYVKTQVRQHDVFGQIYGLLISLKSMIETWVKIYDDPDEGSEEEATDKYKFLAMQYAIGTSAVAENFKSLHDLLGEWVSVYKDKIEKANNIERKEDIKFYIQWLEALQGAFAVKLDHLAWHYQNDEETALTPNIKLSMTYPGPKGKVNLNHKTGQKDALSLDVSNPKEKGILHDTLGLTSSQIRYKQWPIYLNPTSGKPLDGSYRNTKVGNQEGDLFTIYGNKTADKPCQVEITLEAGLIKKIEILDQGEGFYVTPVLRIKPKYFLGVRGGSSKSLVGLNKVVVEAEREERVEEISEGNFRESEFLRKELEKHANQIINNIDNKEDAKKIKNKWKHVFEHETGEGGTIFLMSSLVNLNPYDIQDSDGVFKQLKDDKVKQRYPFKSISLIDQWKESTQGKYYRSGNYKDPVKTKFLEGAPAIRRIIYCHLNGPSGDNDCLSGVSVPTMQVDGKDVVTVNPDVEKLTSIDIFGARRGYCSSKEIKKIDEKLSKTAFGSLASYAAFIQEQTIREGVCRKTSCGAVQANMVIPSMGGENLCGNIHLKWNFHPAATYRDAESAEGKFLGHILNKNRTNITKNLAVEKSAVYKWSDYPSTPVGNVGNIALPRVFGNYTFALKHGNERSFLGSLFKSIFASITFGASENLYAAKNPTIDSTLVPYTKLLLSRYHLERLDWLGRSTVNDDGGDVSIVPQNSYIPTSSFSPEDDYWKPSDSKNLVLSQRDTLKSEYEAVVAAGGHSSWKKQAHNSIDISPRLSFSRNLTGLCHPIVKEYGVAKRKWVQREEGPLHESWQPYANIRKEKQEISIGHKESSDGMPAENSFVLTENPSSSTAISNKKNVTSSSQYKSSTWIDKGHPWRILVEGLDSKLQESSKFYKQINIEDIAYVATIRESGLKAGGMDIADGPDFISNLGEHELLSHSIDVSGYVKHAIKNPNSWTYGTKKTEEPWDGTHAKDIYRIPQHVNGFWAGASMITGELKPNEAEAFASAKEQYKGYLKYGNKYNYSGQGVTQDGVLKESTTIYEGVGYDKTNVASAQTAAKAALDATDFSEGDNLSVWWYKIESEQVTAKFNGVSIDTISSCPSTASTVEATSCNWDPIEPRINSWCKRLITGKGNTSSTTEAQKEVEANSNWTTNKLKSSPYASDGCGCNWSSTKKHVLASTQNSWSAGGSTAAAAQTAAESQYQAYSEGQYALFGNGMSVGPHGWAETTSSSSGPSANCGVGAAYIVDDWWDEVGNNNLYTMHSFYSGFASEWGLSDYICSVTASDCNGGDYLNGTNCNFAFGELVDDEDEAHGFWLGMSGLRNKAYQSIRNKLSNGKGLTGLGATPSDPAQFGSNQYSFASIDSTLKVYPNTAAIQANHAPYKDGSAILQLPSNWYGEGSLTAAHQAGVKTHAQLSGQLIGSAGGSFDNIINLKEFTAGTGDIDIYIEEIYVWGDKGASNCVNSNGQTLYHMRDLSQYKFLTSVFKPNDMSNPNGAYDSNAGLCGDHTYTITAAEQPVVITGSGDCPMYEQNVYKSVVEGRTDTIEKRAWIPLLRNTYSGHVVASGWGAAITGKVDWSSSKKQVWEPSYCGPGALMQNAAIDPEWSRSIFSEDIESLCQEEGTQEVYYVEYPEKIKIGDTRLGKRITDMGRAANENGVKENPEISKTLQKEVGGTIAKAGQRAFIGGFPIVNPSHKHADSNLTKTIFGKKYIIYDNNNKESDIDKVIAKSAEKVFVTNVLNQKMADSKDSFITNDKDKFEKSVLEASSYQNASIESTFVFKIMVKNGQLSSKKINDTVWKAYKEGMLNKTLYDSLKTAAEPKEYFYQAVVFNVTASSCDTCLSTPVSVDYDPKAENKIDDKVVYMGENYIQGIQIDWELRSGGWAFTVPYLEQGQQINFEDKTIITKHWSDYIDHQFMNDGSSKYTGHHTAFDVLGGEVGHEIECSMENQSSKLNKIRDYSLNFDKKVTLSSIKGGKDPNNLNINDPGNKQ